VPIGWEENVPLSNWVSKQVRTLVVQASAIRLGKPCSMLIFLDSQRQEYKLLQKGKATRLTEERIESLKRIGFVWEAKRGAPRQVIVSGDQQTSTAEALQSIPQEQERSPPSSTIDNTARNDSAHATTSTPSSESRRAVRAVRGMRPASPPTSASAPGPAPPSVPAASARVPPPPPPAAHHGSYYYGMEAPYHPTAFHPSRPEYYSPRHHQPYPHYASSFSPAYPPATASAPSSFFTYERYNPNMPSPLIPLHAPAWPRTGRVLTPLFPVDPQPPGSGYPVATAAPPPESTEYERSVADSGVVGYPNTSRGAFYHDRGMSSQEAAYLERARASRYPESGVASVEAEYHERAREPPEAGYSDMTSREPEYPGMGAATPRESGFHGRPNAPREAGYPDRGVAYGEVGYRERVTPREAAYHDRGGLSHEAAYDDRGRAPREAAYRDRAAARDVESQQTQQQTGEPGESVRQPPPPRRYHY
jgi:hypothetical protein